MANIRRIRCRFPKSVDGVFGSIVLVLAITTACTNDKISPSIAGPATESLMSAAGGSLNTDEEYEQIARHEIPGFAGYYLTKDRNVVVQLTDLAQSPVAESHAGEFRSRFFSTASSAPPIIHSVRWDFVQLRYWEEGVVEALKDVKAVIDIDEVRNLVWVGVEDQELISKVLTVAENLGIPSSAITVEFHKLPVPRYCPDCGTTLQDAWPPSLGGIPAGMKIEDDHSYPAFPKQCSIGYNAIYQGQPAFVTASHCTFNQYSLSDAKPMWQPFPGLNGEHQVGFEIWDRPFYACSPGLSCRWSDAALIAYNPTVESQLGIVAWPPDEGFGRAGSVELGEEPGTYYISTKWTTSIPVGAVVSKVGMKSGRTTGWVTRSCVAYQDFECSYETDVWSEHGDSGAGFLLLSHPNPGLAIAGQLYGGPEGDWSDTYFTTLNGLERDLGGTLSVCYPGWGC